MWLLGVGAILLIAIVAGLILVAVNFGSDDTPSDEAAQGDGNAAAVEQPDTLPEPTSTEGVETASEPAATDTPVPPSATPEEPVTRKVSLAMAYNLHLF